MRYIFSVIIAVAFSSSLFCFIGETRNETEFELRRKK